mmetsp:Transcript_10337/g.29473  ORF Transcript_10337/g.29473 Transcript_10337/m.29473 type:complete len:416 (+) Transcript_10337:192-1439(+)|eukprot:CAMPEP_0119545634 /NCGR_PEP_ID=MMETSP1352-20130426/325_1 /TAXON_ID=265584 /ORGANISM="Stauroneis constricta, Strain CCMP1120" /LENGTH=415 /DNA_ID=CAMNT_0007590207 /DNA_START=179 /DNA_END=1426 /DNA_ORIENTATION=+
MERPPVVVDSIRANEQAAEAVSEVRKKKNPRKKRKNAPSAGADGGGGGGAEHDAQKKQKKTKQRRIKEKDESKAKKNRKQQRRATADRENGLTPAQIASNEQMRKALEEDQYSANGSIVDTDSEDEDTQCVYRGQPIRLDRNHLMQAARKHLWLERTGSSAGAFKGSPGTAPGAVPGSVDDLESRRASRKKKKKGKRSKDDDRSTGSGASGDVGRMGDKNASADDSDKDEGSIFGQTTGQSNATWVECDKCKKWRRLRGVVDEKKLPSKWYCSMNKNDPERARCSAPEEKYDASHTPESAADARTRKHLRVWVRRLQSNEAYESRQPTLTRGKKRQVTTSAKEPYEWIRCCNPSCGKWRAILRTMDAKTNVMDRTNDGEWYCVMNTWDEKIASCAAPQENLPAIGCPPWVLQDNN